MGLSASNPVFRVCNGRILLAHPYTNGPRRGKTCLWRFRPDHNQNQPASEKIDISFVESLDVIISNT